MPRRRPDVPRFVRSLRRRWRSCFKYWVNKNIGSLPSRGWAWGLDGWPSPPALRPALYLVNDKVIMRGLLLLLFLDKKETLVEQLATGGIFCSLLASNRKKKRHERVTSPTVGFHKTSIALITPLPRHVLLSTVQSFLAQCANRRVRIQVDNQNLLSVV